MPIIHHTFQCFSHLLNRLSGCAVCRGIVSSVCFCNMCDSCALAHPYTQMFSCTCPARQNVGNEAAVVEFCLSCCLFFFFFSLFPAGVNERGSLQYLVSSCTGSEEQQRRNAPSCWYSEGGDRMARCLPQVDGNWSSKCLCMYAPMYIYRERRDMYICMCVYIHVYFCVSVCLCIMFVYMCTFLWVHMQYKVFL